MVETAKPRPLVPSDVDIRDFAFMPLDVSRLRDSDLAANETPEACWAAVLLWAASWHQVPAASIPNDDRWIAKHAGYAQRGKVAREWAAVRQGALRNWVECSDGRLYHPVVAEKAMEAWKAKLRQRWNAECARIKKHNQRHGTSLPNPSFEEWSEQGCPSGQALFVPRDTEPGPEDTGGDKASKGQGEGQGQGQGQSKAAAQPRDGGDRDRPSARFDRILAACQDALGPVAPADPVIGPIVLLVDRGAKLEEICTILRSEAQRPRKRPILTWKLWAEIVVERLADAPAATPASNAAPADPDDPRIDFGCGIRWPTSQVRRAVLRHRDDPATWPDILGAPPGQPYCRVPKQLLEEIAA